MPQDIQKYHDFEYVFFVHTMCSHWYINTNNYLSSCSPFKQHVSMSQTSWETGFKDQLFRHYRSVALIEQTSAQTESVALIEQTSAQTDKQTERKTGKVFLNNKP